MTNAQPTLFGEGSNNLPPAYPNRAAWGTAQTVELRPKQPPELKLATTQNSLSPLFFFLVIATLAAHWWVIRGVGGSGEAPRRL